MIDEGLLRRLATNPRTQQLRMDIVARFQVSREQEIESACLDDLVENLAILGVLFGRVRPSISARARSIVQNDCFFVAVVFLLMLHERWSLSDQSSTDLACLETIAALLSGVAAKSEQLCSTVEREIVAAYLVATALRNARRGIPLLQGVEESVYRESELHRVPLTAVSDLRDLMGEMQHRFAGLLTSKR